MIHFILQLPSSIGDSEIARLAPLFSPSTLETVAIQYFDISQTRAETLKEGRTTDKEGFKRDLLTDYRNKGYKRKVIILKSPKK